MLLLICVVRVVVGVVRVGVVLPKVVILLIFKIILGLHRRHHYLNIVIIIVSGLSGRLNFLMYFSWVMPSQVSRTSCTLPNSYHASN